MKIYSQERKNQLINTTILTASIFNTNLAFTGREIKKMTKNRINSSTYPPTEFILNFYKYYLSNKPVQQLSKYKRYYIKFDSKEKRLYVKKAPLM